MNGINTINGINAINAINALVIENLKKNYANNKLAALKGINLTVQQGDFFALLGPNGAGKSTIIGILSSLIHKTSGSVKVFGFDLDNDLEEVKSCVGVVPQEMNFNPFEKIMDVVVNQGGYYGVTRKIALERAEYYFKKLGIWEKRYSSVMQLSGGMKRRLMIARALINQPRLLILDEPTAGVDIELRHILWDFLIDLNKNTHEWGTTIILTTHYLEEAEYLCKNIAIIDGGEIIVNADKKSLIESLSNKKFILDLAQPISAATSIEIGNIKIIDKQSIEVSLSKNQSLNDLFQQLSAKHIEVKNIGNKTSRLEELFVQLVGENKIKKDNLKESEIKAEIKGEIK